MQVEVKQPPALQRDLVKPHVELAKCSRGTEQPVRSPPQIRKHRRPVHAFQHESVANDVVNLRDRVSMCAGVLHHLRLAQRVAAALEAAQNATVADVDDLGSPPGGDHMHTYSFAREHGVADHAWFGTKSRPRGTRRAESGSNRETVAAKFSRSHLSSHLAEIGRRARVSVNSGRAFGNGRAMEELQTDAALIAAAGRAPELFGVVFDRHFGTIHRYLDRRAGRDVADDLAGEVFRIAFEQRRRFVPVHESALPWLYGLATRTLLKH